MNKNNHAENNALKSGGSNLPDTGHHKLQKLYENFEPNEYNQGWYNSLKRYSEIMQSLKAEVIAIKVKNYEELNHRFKILVGSPNEDFLETYLFRSDAKLATISQQLIKHVNREKIRDQINNDFNLLANVIKSNNKREATNLIHAIADQNAWAVLRRFVRALFPFEFTSIDVDSHFETLKKNLKTNFNIKLQSKDKFDQQKEVLSLLNHNDIYKAQIFFWALKSRAVNSDVLLFAETKSITLTHMPLNQILYGPPGTGKTYNTINKAVSIVNPSFDLTQDRSIIKAEYNRLLEAGQIVFTTFHQSMCYEDFVEGIKPLKPVPSDTFVKYDIQPGIFRNICKLAETNIALNLSINKSKKPFEEVFEKLKLDWEDDNTITFPLKTVGYDYSIIGFTSTSIQFKKASGGTGHTLSIKTLEDLYYGKEYDFKAGVGIYYPAILNRLQSYNDLEEENAVNRVSQEKNYVLIIDEINRGNVSAIFGELITLIEESKRTGKAEALEVTLPYSKEKFSVPSNLYIIGTMNTTDRSVEALDTALRRRFAFTELMPDPTLIRTDGALKDSKGVLLVDESNLINLPEILELINKRIVALLDVNHQIGHSYFINVKNLEDLADAFKNCIIPLLQEYFYHDEEKIALVLGEGFVSTEEKNIQADKLFPRLTFVNRLPNLKPTYHFSKITAETVGEALTKFKN